jgi:predicted ATP-dependent endonuclease of OLD family
MFIHKLKIRNFKCFGNALAPLNFNIPDGRTPGSGLNIFVGENNTGKSTVFEVIDFLRDGTKKNIYDYKNRNANEGEDVSVELTFNGNVNDVINNFSQQNKVSVFKKYVYDHEDKECFRLLRSSKDIKAIQLWDIDTQEFKNESGIDAPLKKLFETNFVWSDTNPNDQMSFGSTTICGNLLKEIAKDFTETEDYLKFSEQFHKTFNHKESGLRKELKTIEEMTREIFAEQFSDAQIKFRFNEVKTDSFFKNIRIDIDDGIETPMEEKGSGMQRSIALALLQVYAEELVKHSEKESVNKPFFLFIDEPEICLHPRAQMKLFKAILNLTKTKQIFLATHSPYFFADRSLMNIGLFIFKRKDNNSNVEKIDSNWGLFPWSPSWGEINYQAYNLPMLEFHNELYGYMQEKNKKFSQNDIEKYFEDIGLKKVNKWTREKNGIAQSEQDVTLQTFIRNKVHHPENSTMQTVEYTQNELSQSIEEMIDILKSS